MPADLYWFFDFHSHRDVRIGHAPDPEGVARALAEHGVIEMTTHAKSHDGYTYYPTDLDKCYRHPQMKGDPFGDIVNACAARGVRPLAYISFGIDGEGARHNPHWRQHTINGPMENDDWFICVCPYTGYIEETILPQIEEVITRYPVVEGFFFDTMSALGPCYCEYCTKAFADEHNTAIPREAGDDGWAVYGKWRHDRGINLIGEVGAFIQKLKPGAAVGFNQIGSPPYPEALPDGCNRLTLDFATSSHQSRQAARCAAYGSTAPHPADIMPTIFNGGWGDWTVAPNGRHEQIAAAIWARGSTAYFGDRLHPDNRLADATWPALKHISAARDRFNQHAPADDAAHAPDVVLLHGTSMQYGPDFRTFAMDARVNLWPFDGATDLLVDAGANYTIAAEYCLENAIADGQLIIVPQLPAIDAATAKLLRAHCEAGGNVLFVGGVPDVDGQSLDWPGVTFDDKPWQDHIYLPTPNDPRCDHPVLVRGDFHVARCAADVEVVQHAIQPIDMSHGVMFGWGISPPSPQPSEHAALTRRAIGKGAAWVMPARLFSSYHDMNIWQQVPYMTSLLATLQPAPRLTVESQHGQVEIVGYTTADAAWAVLVNHGGETLCADPKRPWPRTWGPLPAHEVVVVARDARKPSRVTVDGEPVDFDMVDGAARIAIRLDTAWRIVRIDY